MTAAVREVTSNRPKPGPNLWMYAYTAEDEDDHSFDVYRCLRCHKLIREPWDGEAFDYDFCPYCGTRWEGQHDWRHDPAYIRRVELRREASSRKGKLLPELKVLVQERTLVSGGRTDHSGWNTHASYSDIGGKITDGLPYILFCWREEKKKIDERWLHITGSPARELFPDGLLLCGRVAFVRPDGTERTALHYERQVTPDKTSPAPPKMTPS